VIQGVAQALQHNARATDWVGRWGGDEFMVVMPNTDAHAAQQAMQRLRDLAQQTGLALPAGCGPLGLSIGIATLEPSDLQVNDLVMRADARMYQAKRGQSEPVLPDPTLAPSAAASQATMRHL
jgi:diguanylate cyclase (GGDEF)-like protein